MALDTFKPYLFVSAGEQSNKFLTPAYADGIAKFQAQRAQELTGLTVRIDMIQEGTGDPSPDNIRSISGRTGLTVMTAGKNLIDDSKKAANSALTAITIGQTAGYGTPLIFLKAGTYTFSVEFAEGVSGAGYVKVGSASGTRIWQAGQTQGTITLTDDSMCSFYVYNSDTPFTAVSDVVHAQVEAGENASKYTAYSGAAYPVTWETEAGTVYGGTLDVVSGVLTVDKALATVSSADGISTVGSAGHGFLIARTTGIEPKNTGSNYATGVISDKFPAAVVASSLASNAIFVDNYGRIRFNTETQYSSVDDMFTAVGEFSIVYPVETPLTYQLDPEQVMTIPGFNQVYSDAGPVIDIKF